MIISKEEEHKLQKWFSNASSAYKNSDTGRWEAARWCAKIVGTYERGATIGLAEEMGVSCDTVENLAHAYLMFIELASRSKYRSATRMARQAPRVYYSHFRALYTARHRYKLTLAEVFDTLRDIVLDEGGISSREVDAHISDKYGREKDWMYYSEQTNKRLAKMLGCPDLPAEGRKIASDLFNWIGENVI